MKLKLSQIKAELRKMLLEMSVIKTDKAVLSYEGEELKEGTQVFIEDEEGNRTEVENGEYVAEDGTTYVVDGGKIAEIIEPKEEETAEAEETVEPEQTEEVVEAEDVVEEVTDETTTEEAVEPEQTEETVEPDVVAELEGRVAELEGKLNDALAKLEELVERIAKISVAKPIAEEFEQVKEVKKTGYSKVDKFMEKYGNK
jgi:hypothetical protein